MAAYGFPTVASDGSFIIRWQDNPTPPKHFTPEELSGFLHDKRYVDNGRTPHSDAKKRAAIQDLIGERSAVASSLYTGLTHIISTCLARSNISQSSPIIEIGSNLGYTFSEALSKNTLCIQPSLLECELLSRPLPYPRPLFTVSIAELYSRLSSKKQKIPLFFALNFFDSLPAEEQLLHFRQLSCLQSPGDRLLILLDSHPNIPQTIAKVQAIHPASTIVPYYDELAPLSKKWVRPISHTILSYADKTPDFVAKMIHDETQCIFTGQMSNAQKFFQGFKVNSKQPVYDLMEVYISTTREQLKTAGYNTSYYYQHQAFFTVGATPDGWKSEKELIYRSLSEYPSLQAYSREDAAFQAKLEKREIVDNPSLFQIEPGQKILGSEILVIEAIKT